MKQIIWKIIYHTVRRWEKTARRKGQTTQTRDCIQVCNRLEHYRDTMIRDGIWRIDG